MSQHLLITASQDHTVRFWNVETNSCIRIVQNGRSVNKVASNVDVSFIAYGSDDHTAYVVPIGADVQSPYPLKKHSAAVTSVAFSHDGTVLASGSLDQTICLWDVHGYSSNSFKAQLTGHSLGVKDVCFSADSTHLYSASLDKTIGIWNVLTGKLATQLTGHEGPVNAIARSEEGKILASVSDDGTARLWDALQHALVRVLKGHVGSVNAVDFSPDGVHVASAGADGNVFVWNIATGDTARIIKSSVTLINSLAFASEGTTIVTACNAGLVHQWSTKSGELVKRFEGHAPYAVHSLVYRRIPALIQTTPALEAIQAHETEYYDHLPLVDAIHELSTVLAKSEFVVAATKERAKTDEIRLLREYNKEIDALESRIRALKATRDGITLQVHAVHEPVVANVVAQQGRLRQKLHMIQEKLRVWEGKVSSGELKHLTQEDVEMILSFSGVHDVKQVISRQNLTGDALFKFTEEGMIKDLGITALGDRRRLLKVLHSLSNGTLGTVAQPHGMPGVGVAAWTIEQVYVWVRSAGLSSIAFKFVDERITGDVLLELTTNDLINMVSTLPSISANTASKLAIDIAKLRVVTKSHNEFVKLVCSDESIYTEAEQLHSLNLFRFSGLLGDKSISPAAFLCPLTGEILNKPVVAADGYTYESFAIKAWLHKFHTSPMTGKHIDDKLKSDDALQARIEAFLSKSVQPARQEYGFDPWFYLADFAS